MSGPKRIGRIKFGLLSPQMINKMGVTKIVTADTYDEDGFPIEMGLMDQRLGVIDPGLRCKTCGGRVGECPGHFGKIVLVEPVIHPGFAKLLYRILQSVCRKCHRVLLKDEDIKRLAEEAKAKVDALVPVDEIAREVAKEAMKNTKCPHCGELQKTIKFEKPTTFYEDGEKLTPRDVKERVENLTDDEIRIFGLDPEIARPDWMIIRVLPVPPVTTRPSITLEGGQRSEDDLTHKLVDIIRINQRFQENKDAGAPQLIMEDLWELLQYHVTTYFDNEASGIPPARHRSGRPLKTLSQRLKGKEGRFRGSLSGKRVNFSARTVVSPDPNLSIDEVGVPEDVARELTIPVTVTPRNIEVVREWISRGPEYPGVNYVKRLDGRRVKVTEKNCKELAEQVEVGWVVERQLRDGDWVLFNRQPSLHRMSMMAHRVRVIPRPNKTFRLNPAVCPPYNADFDGDEMNLHVPQTEEARAELRLLMAVQEHILSPRFGGPIVGGIHDHVTGLFMLTHGERRFNKMRATRIISRTSVRRLPEPAGYENGEPYWTGKQLFSLILPRGLNIAFRAKICTNCGRNVEGKCAEECDRDAYVIIRNGQLLKGTVDEEGVGAFKGKILDKIVKEFGSEEGMRFLNDATRMAIGTLDVLGFTIAISDEDLPRDAILQIEENMRRSKEITNELLEAYIRGELEPMPGRSPEETFEMKMMHELGRARDDAGRIAERHLSVNNPGVIMAVSGARGSMLNLTQMAACVGQQSIRGERIMRGYRDRTLSHFRRNEKGAEARGFVSSSYKKGLNPTEYFFHAMGGREGLVDTAVRTSQSGYLQRRLINALQDVGARYDGTTRVATDDIVQFTYGEDGVDPSKSDYGKPINIPRIIERVVGEIIEE